MYSCISVVSQGLNQLSGCNMQRVLQCTVGEHKTVTSETSEKKVKCTNLKCMGIMQDNLSSLYTKYYRT